MNDEILIRVHSLVLREAPEGTPSGKKTSFERVILATYVKRKELRRLHNKIVLFIFGFNFF
jgi:hypothetical protein